MEKKKQSGSKAGWVIVPAVLVLGWGAVWGGWFTSKPKAEIKGARVERGPLTISVLQRGNLAAKDAISVKSELEGQSTVLFLIPEGTFIKPGDLLVELDASELTDKKVAQDISAQNAEATYIKAKAGYDIQESQNKSDVEAAARKLMFAEVDEKKYIEGDYDQLKKAAEEKIKIAEAELARAKNTYDWSKNLAERKFLTKTELDRDELDFERAEITLEQAKRGLLLLEKFDDPRKRTELRTNREEAERGLERAKLQAASRLVDYDSALVTSKAKLELEKEKLQKYIDQIGKAKIRAKEAGMVVYTRSEGGRMGGDTPMQEGATVRERQEILTIPRTNGLIVEASVHESVLKRVTSGKPCKIRVDAIPEKEFDGIVSFVALLPDKNSWWANPNQRLYRTEIQVTNPTSEMKPGMSCALEILSERIADCLSVPLQAVVLDKGKPSAFVVEGNGNEQRTVEVGRSNDTKVEILSGLKEGEEVLLAPPPGFTPQGAEEAPNNEKDMPPMMRPDGGMPGNGGMNVPANGPGTGPAASDGEKRPSGMNPGGENRGPGGNRGNRGGGRRGEGGGSGVGSRDGATKDGAKEGTGSQDGSGGGGTAPAKPAEGGSTGEKPGGQSG
jgi:HlyD family secretion protein